MMYPLPRTATIETSCTNKDGKIDRSEHGAFAAQRGASGRPMPSFDEILAMGDKDGDGALSSGELPAPQSGGGDASIEDMRQQVSAILSAQRLRMK